MTLTLVLGGMSSGKSAHAVDLARGFGDRVCVVATGVASDDEMRQRIDAHRRSRPAEWTLYEQHEPVAGAVPSGSADVVLLDSVDGWLSDGCDADRCLDAVRSLHAAVPQIVAVSSEVGMSLVPLTSVGRRFTDALGAVNQALAAEALHVVVVIAGLPLTIK